MKIINNLYFVKSIKANPLESAAKFSIIIFLTLGLSNCAGTNSTFTCHASSGGGCQSLDRVNRKVNQGHYQYQSQPVTSRLTKVNFSDDESPSGYPLKTYDGKPIWYGNRVQRIWIAPYVDQDNNYHEPSYVYTVLKTSHWIGRPLTLGDH